VARLALEIFLLFYVTCFSDLRHADLAARSY
jgi:hypothetical protein